MSQELSAGAVDGEESGLGEQFQERSEAPIIDITALDAAIPSTPLALPAPAPSALPIKPKKSNKYIDQIQNKFIETIGTNEDLRSALALSPSPKFQRFLTLLVNPKYSDKPLARLARIAEVEPQDLLELLRNYHNTVAMTKFIRSAPTVADAIIEDAKSTQIECPRCDGLGKIKSQAVDISTGQPELLLCPRCRGAGTVRKPGDSDSRKIIAETVGWTKGKAGVNVNVVNNHLKVESVIDEIERANGPAPHVTIDI